MTTKKSFLILPTLGLALVTGAFAQDRFNVDFGSNTTFSAPASTYGAAADQDGNGNVGFWNAREGFGGTSAPLSNLSGGATNVTITISDGSNFEQNNPSTSGDDEALMDDIHAPASGGSVLTVDGLPNGIYTIYTYAMSPCNITTHATEVNVPLSIDPPQVVQGLWPGAFSAGMTHVVHNGVQVSGGTSVDIELGLGAVALSCNGLQILPDPLAQGPIGTNYCTGNTVPNSTGSPGVITAFGNTHVALNRLTLTASQVPPGQFGYFLNSQTQGFFMPPGSDGFLCLAGAIGRYNQPGNIGQGPTFSIQVDLTAVPQPTGPVAVQPGDFWNFQAWYRDLGNTSNFTNAVTIAFQ